MISPATSNWSFLTKILFRFFLVYLLLQAAQWLWFYRIPGAGLVLKYYGAFMDWIVEAANAHLFHIRKVLLRPPGSGDTSWNWAQQWLFLCIAFAGSLIWSILDRKRQNYIKLNYWLCLVVRYSIIGIAFNYGLVKLFPLQMHFPNQSQLVTPLGDFLPMRLSWMFMGYSATYQIFAGVTEVLAGALLLYRKTVTLGTLLAVAVFSNVLMMNLSYDIPVKLLSMNIVLLCLYLLANEYNRLVCFFVLNKPASMCSLYHFTYQKRWMRITRIILKMAFMFQVVVMSFYGSWLGYKALDASVTTPIKSGLYEVASFAVNKDTLPRSISDTLRWQDVVFEKDGSGSVKTSDTIFRQYYKRGYFKYETDTIKRTITFKKSLASNSVYGGIILLMHYELPDSNTVKLSGKANSDSLYVLLKRSDRHFQLAEKQFHWLSEYNR